MGLFVEFDVVDDFHYLDETERFGIVPDYSEGCQIFADIFLAIAEELVPVDTGYLSSTIEADGDDTSCWAETDCEYAQYPEFGTWCQAAQPYFTPALEGAILKAKPLWDAAELAALQEEQYLIEEEERAAAAEGAAAEGAEGEGAEGGGGGGSTSSGSSSFMDFAIDIAAKFIVAFFLVILEAITGQDLQPGKELGSKAQVYIPDVIIM